MLVIIPLLKPFHFNTPKRELKQPAPSELEPFLFQIRFSKFYKEPKKAFCCQAKIEIPDVP